MRFKLKKQSMGSFGIATAVLLLAVVFFVPLIDSPALLASIQNPLSEATQAENHPQQWAIAACLPKTSSDQTQGMLAMRVHPWLLFAWSLLLPLSFGLKIRENKRFRAVFVRHMLICVGTHAPPSTYLLA